MTKVVIASNTKDFLIASFRPTIWDTLRINADYLKDQGLDDLAKAYEWLAEMKSFPHIFTTYDYSEDFFELTRLQLKELKSNKGKISWFIKKVKSNVQMTPRRRQFWDREDIPVSKSIKEDGWEGSPKWEITELGEAFLWAAQILNPIEIVS